MKLTFKLVRFYYSLLSRIAPNVAGKQAFELFQKPHFKKLRTRELALFDEFDEIRIPSEEEDLYVYVKGDANAYPVVLVHGWDSNPGSMYGLGAHLLKEGFRVIIIGLPAHGKSKLKKTNMIHSAEQLQLLLKHFKLVENFSMVTHSFGSGTSTISLGFGKQKVDSLIFLTTPDRIGDIFDEFADMIKLGDKALDALKETVNSISPIPVEDFNISDLIKKVDYKKIYLIHDQFDKVLPWHNAHSMKSKNPEILMFPTQYKGHYRMLWDDEVFSFVSKFLESYKK